MYKTLNYSGKTLSSVDIQAIIETLQKSDNIVILKLNSADFTKVKNNLRCLIKAICSSTTLKKLDLSYATGIRKQETRELFNAIQNNTSLECLELVHFKSFKYIYYVNLVCDIIKNNHQLKSINISSEEIKKKLPSIKDALQENQTIEEIIFFIYSDNRTDITTSPEYEEIKNLLDRNKKKSASSQELFRKSYVVIDESSSSSSSTNRLSATTCSRERSSLFILDLPAEEEDSNCREKTSSAVSNTLDLVPEFFGLEEEFLLGEQPNILDSPQLSFFSSVEARQKKQPLVQSKRAIEEVDWPEFSLAKRI